MAIDWSDPNLLADIRAIEQEARGVLCLAAQDLQTGERFRYNSDRRCKTASVIKLPMLVHIAMAENEGWLRWNDPLTLTDAEKVAGSGVLNQLTAGLQLTLKDACVLMTVVSDNTATNMLIELVGVEAINARMRSLGLPLTTLYRKSYTPDTEASKPYGLGMTTPDEIADLIVLIAEGKAGNPEASSQIREILSGQTLRDAIPRWLPSDWKYAGKTGGVDGVRNDVALITDPTGGRFVLSLFCQQLQDVRWSPENHGLRALSDIARRLLGWP